jgi:hypothetical protein
MIELVAKEGREASHLQWRGLTNYDDGRNLRPCPQERDGLPSGFGDSLRERTRSRTFGCQFVRKARPLLFGPVRDLVLFGGCSVQVVYGRR